MFGSWLKDPESLRDVLDFDNEIFHIGFLKVDSGSVDCVSTNLYVHSAGYTIESTLVNNHRKNFRMPGEHVLKSLKELKPGFDLLAYNRGQIVLASDDQIFDVAIGRNFRDEDMYITDTHSKIVSGRIAPHLNDHSIILDTIVNSLIRQDMDFAYMLGFNPNDMNHIEKMKELYMGKIRQLSIHSNN